MTLTSRDERQFEVDALFLCSNIFCACYLFLDETHDTLEMRLDEFLGRHAFSRLFSGLAGDAYREIVKLHLLMTANNPKTRNIINLMLDKAEMIQFIHEKGNLITLRNLLDASKGERFLGHELWLREKKKSKDIEWTEEDVSPLSVCLYMWKYII